MDRLGFLECLTEYLGINLHQVPTLIQLLLVCRRRIHTVIVLLGIISIKGTYPYTDNEEFHKVLTVGPMTRYAEDLKLMMNVMAGENVKKLNTYENVSTIFP